MLQQRGGVGGFAPDVLLIFADEADQHSRSTCHPGQAIQQLQILLNELPPEKQVAWRITGGRQFRKDDEVSARFNAAAIGSEDLRLVARKVADRGVYLGERDLHATALPQKDVAGSSVYCRRGAGVPRQMERTHAQTPRNLLNIRPMQSADLKMIQTTTASFGRSVRVQCGRPRGSLCAAANFKFRPRAIASRNNFVLSSCNEETTGLHWHPAGGHCGLDRYRVVEPEPTGTGKSQELWWEYCSDLLGWSALGGGPWRKYADEFHLHE
jgi:hypothetical protein